MAMERFCLLASTVIFFLGFAYTMYALRSRMLRPSRWSLLIMSVGFVLLTEFLNLRGRAVGRCPLTNLFEVLVFLSWAVVLLYFVVGGTYRLSLLGAFTAPLVFLLLTVAQLSPSAALPAMSKPSAGLRQPTAGWGEPTADRGPLRTPTSVSPAMAMRRSSRRRCGRT